MLPARAGGDAPYTGDAITASSSEVIKLVCIGYKPVAFHPGLGWTATTVCFNIVQIICLLLLCSVLVSANSPTYYHIVGQWR